MGEANIAFINQDFNKVPRRTRPSARTTTAAHQRGAHLFRRTAHDRRRAACWKRSYATRRVSRRRTRCWA